MKDIQTEIMMHACTADDIQDIVASRKSDDTDDPVDALVYDPMAIRLTHLFIKAGWLANMVTFLSLVFGVTGAMLFYPENIWVNLLGITFVIFAAILDCSDGQVARLTHTGSQFGRVLDGTTDALNFLAIYLALGLRMTCETIPFTRIQWSYRIWILIAVTMLAHAGQARMADFYRGMHLYFLNGRSADTLSRSKRLREELDSLPEGCPLYERIYRFIYLIYTKAQERTSQASQQLLDAAEENGADVSGDLSSAFVERSRKYIQLTNILTFNARAYTLFVLLLFRQHAFYFPAVLLVFGGIKCFMIARYEKIADSLLTEFFSGDRRNGAAG